jgi:hypothetical protein
MNNSTPFSTSLVEKGVEVVHAQAKQKVAFYWFFVTYKIATFWTLKITQNLSIPNVPQLPRAGPCLIY